MLFVKYLVFKQEENHNECKLTIEKYSILNIMY